MTTRLVLICHAATAATRSTAFPRDEPITPPTSPSHSTAPLTERVDLALCGPATRCRQTAAALGLHPFFDERLRDADYGSWAGRTLTELTETEPAEVRRWLTDPAARPHGGESTEDIIERVAGWLDELPRDQGRVVAVTHPAVIKAAVVHAIHAPARSFWRIDVPPLSRTVLSGRPTAWTLRLPACT